MSELVIDSFAGGGARLRNPGEFPVGAIVRHGRAGGLWRIEEHGPWWTDLRSEITGRTKRLNSLNNPHYVDAELPMRGYELAAAGGGA